MQSAAVFVALIAAASATSLVYRVPSQDSAVINSQRLGGNFAYNVVEGQAYGVQTPVYQYQATPVQTTYSQIGASGIVQTSQGINGQKLTYQAQAVPVSQTYGQVYGNQVYSQVYGSPVVASTYSVPATSVVAAGTPASTYKTYAGVSPINYGNVYGYQYGNAVVV